MFAQRNIAYVLLIVMLGLITLGLVMLTSTSAVLATVNMDGVYHNLHKQIFWLSLGGMACVVLSRYDYQKLLNYSPWILGFACFLLVLCLVPHIGARINGSPRWIRLGSWTYQPSEFAKLALILFLSWWMGKNHRRAGEFLKGFIWPIAITLPVFLLMVVQKDFGTTAIMLGIVAALLFCAGTNPFHLGTIALLAAAGLAITASYNPERLGRMKAWWTMVHHSNPVMTDEEAGRQVHALIGDGSAKQVLNFLKQGDTQDVVLVANRAPQAFSTLAKDDPKGMSAALKNNLPTLDVMLETLPRIPDGLADNDDSLKASIVKERAMLAKGDQQHQALIALGSGGMTGLGLGNSRQKMYWLPEVNTDFVFPIIGEELGMWVTLFVVFSFLIMLVCSGWITFHAPDPAGVCLGTGITLMIALQAMMNLAVVTSLMPCKGIPLPFISYGGSNLLTCLIGIGILFNLHRQGVYQTPVTPPLVATSYSVRM